MIVELELDENKNTKVNSEPEKYREKKKQLESILDNIHNNKHNTKCDILYDPSSIIQTQNKLQENKKFEENEKKSFSFMKEYFEINKDIDELSGFNFEALEEQLNKEKLNEDKSKSDQKENSFAEKFEQDIRMKNIMDRYDEIYKDSSNKEDLSNEDVSMGEYFDDSKFRKVRKIDQVKKRKNIEEER